MAVKRETFKRADGLFQTHTFDDAYPEGDPDRVINTGSQGFPTKEASRLDARRADALVTSATSKALAVLGEANAAKVKAEEALVPLQDDLKAAQEAKVQAEADLKLCQGSLTECERLIGELHTAVDAAAKTISDQGKVIDDKDAEISAKLLEIESLKEELRICEGQPPPVETKPVLGSGPAIRSDDAGYQPPAGAVAPAGHAYGGIDRGVLQWGTPIGPDTAGFNFRPRKKPAGTGQVAVHVYQGSGGACTVANCGQVSNHQNHDDAITKVLGGQYNALIDQAADQVKAIPGHLFGTVWHEFLEKGELFPGQTVADVGAVIAYVINRFNARGATNVDWYSCPFGTQYASGVADQLHTPALTALLTGYGADIYFTSPDIATGAADLTKNGAWKAFAEYQPNAPHVIFETGLWNATGAQQKAYFEALAKWYADHPNWTALFGFFRNDQSAGHDGRLIVPEGKAAWDAIVAGDVFGRAVA